MRFTILYLMAIPLFVAMSCEAQTNVAPEEAQIVVADTLGEWVLEITPLPDTMYASAEKLMYQIDTFDKTLPSNLSTLEDVYVDKPGIFTFRGSPTRNPNFCGHLTKDSIQIKTEWAFTTRMDTAKTPYGVFEGGSGWTGQPLYVHWPDSLLQRFKAKPNAASIYKDLNEQEIIVASLCGDIYFIDFQTGKQSRPTHNTQNVLKGTPSMNPDLNGHLYIGHGVQKNAPFGNQVFDLFSHTMVHSFGPDKNAWRQWNAYDSSPVIAGGFLFRPGENGTLYKYYVGDGRYTLQSTLRYSLTKAKSTPGMESSLAVYRNYGYVGDNHGNILCVNLNTMRPVWHYWNHDDTDASPVVDVEDGVPYVYTGCEVDKQGSAGCSYFVKLNGLTGELVWEDTIRCHKLQYGDWTSDGGMYSSPLIGEADCDGMIFNAFCIQTRKESGCFMAFDKADGKVLYRTKLKYYCWSSPVAFYNDDNEMFIFIGDVAGNVYLIKGKTGEILASAKVGNNFESSPIIVDNKVVVGSRGNKIYKISLQ